jgi:hypothetical protein
MADSYPYVEHEILVNDKYVALNPQPLIEYLKSRGRPYEHVLKCNRMILTAGREYGRGWLLMRGVDARELYNAQLSDGAQTGTLNAFSHKIKFHPLRNDSEEGVEIKKLGITRIYSVLGYSQDMLNSMEDADHYVIVEFVDARFVARMSTVYKGYNVRSYIIMSVATDSDPDYWGDTLNSGTPWTWEEVLEDLFAMLPSAEFGSGNRDLTLGIYPSFAPQDLKFAGICALDAIMEILRNTGNTLVRDLDGKWWVHSYQNQQTDYDATGLEPFLEDPTWDLPRNPATNRSLIIPEKLVIYFPRMYHAFQALASTKIVDGGDAWSLQSLYIKEETLTTKGMSGTKVGIFAALYADYDEEGNLINGAQLNTAAARMSEEYMAAKGWTSKSLQNIYLYYHDVECGSEVSAVQWSNAGLGARTEVLLNPFRYTPGDETHELGRQHISEILAWECFAPPDIARKHHPVTRFLIAKMDAQLAIDGTGVASVYYGTHTTTSAITWTDSGKDIYVHNKTACIVAANEFVACFWHLQTRRWIVVYAAPPKFYQGTINANMCPVDSASSSDLHNIFCCETLGTTSLANPYKLAGLAGAKVLVYKDCQAGEYRIAQIEHQQFELVKGFNKQEACPYGTYYQDCVLEYKFRNFSVMTCETADTTATALLGQLVEVLTDWWVSGLKIYGYKRGVYVMCKCDPVEVLLHTGTDCGASGSGSGV